MPGERVACASVRAVQIHEFGGPEVLRVADLPRPEPGDSEVLIEVSRAGMNFADTHQRENSYLSRYEVPLVLGGEVAGRTEEGRRVVALVPAGGYAEYAVAHESTVFPIPDGLDDGPALALLIQGLTAWHLFRTAAKLAEGESVVVVAGAGGVGSLAVQLAKPFGAGRVIATASTEEKRALTLSLGADVAVDPAAEDLKEAITSANGGNQVDVVLEMAGGRVFDACFGALAPFGRIVAYGIAGREQNSVETGRLMRKSRGVIGFWLMHCLGRRDMMEEPLADLFGRAARGELRPQVGETYPMSEVRRAHEDLQGRRTTGKLVLDPSLSTEQLAQLLHRGSRLVDDVAPGIAANQAVQPGRRKPGQHSPLTACLDCGDVGGFGTRRAMTHAVNAWKLDDQRPAFHPAVDLTHRQAGGEQLPTRRHTVRPGREPSHDTIHFSVLTTHMVVNAERCPFSPPGRGTPGAE
jgi:NADPH:quinone reductase